MLSRPTLLVTGLVLTQMAHAWGPEGHAIIANIAAANLNANANAEIRTLLAEEGYSQLKDISSWADQTKNAATAPWHYVNIPLRETHYSAERDCANLGCISAQIAISARQLADTENSHETRLTALKYLVHFVGDIHQPLHAENDNDRGGNEVKINYFGKQTNLHSIWDGAILENALGLKLGRNYSFNHAKVREAATTLTGQIAGNDRSTWMSNGILGEINSIAIAWAEESHSLAQQAYAHLPPNLDSDWNSDYQQTAWPIIQTQLQKAGLRLAELLNEIIS